jgi:hypothetical protein
MNQDISYSTENFSASAGHSKCRLAHLCGFLREANSRVVGYYWLFPAKRPINASLSTSVYQMG